MRWNPRAGWAGRWRRWPSRRGGQSRRLAAILAQIAAHRPAGLFARDLAECLALQAADAGELDPAMQGVLCPFAAGGHRGNFQRIWRAETGAPVEAVVLRIARLRRYDPKPGARFGPGAAPVAEPDLTVGAAATAGRWR
jgi:RNA polymerase sigma-54 factor